MNKIKTLFFACLLFISQIASADEGMWLPQLLQQLNEKQMKSLGMKINASDIYNINKGSLKDAIVSFGGFCTGEVISEQGLVLTNHHCGFDAIQNHTTLENNYLKNGFWAQHNGAELPNSGLFVTFIVSIEDVTKKALDGVQKNMAEADRQSTIDKNIAELRKQIKKEDYQDIMVRPFFDGNQYFLFITETYRDVRLVGAPPSSIGNYGKDTDNWMWPRHTGDFSLFRIYAGKDNKPAAYSLNNVPYKPKKSLSISLDGIEKGDFTMVFGFPGRTNQYLPSEAVDNIINITDPARIAIRDKALNVIDAFMRKDEGIKIQYASKYASIQNAYKKWQGEILGMNRTNGLEEKRAYEAEFTRRLEANPAWKQAYGHLLPELTKAHKELINYSLARDYYSEVIGNIEIFTIAQTFNRLQRIMETQGEAGLEKEAPAYRSELESLYKDYNVEVDKKLFATLMKTLVADQGKYLVSPVLADWVDKYDGDFDRIANKLYDESKLDEKDEIMEEWNEDLKDLLKDHSEDEVNLLLISIQKTYSENAASQLAPLQAKINQLQREYMEAQMVVFKAKKFYPDANSTLRVTYGKVNGYEPRDGVAYGFSTDLEGVMEKYVPGDYEFDLPPRLLELYKNKDYGVYGKNGRLPVCFIGTNHTTGGNSGSPALDAYGNLVGLNFDRVWEGTMSDLNYDPSICRNIMVDIRYVLFIIDKFAGAGHLVKEMRLVRPKARVSGK